MRPQQCAVISSVFRAELHTVKYLHNAHSLCAIVHLRANVTITSMLEKYFFLLFFIFFLPLDCVVCFRMNVWAGCSKQKFRLAYIFSFSKLFRNFVPALGHCTYFHLTQFKINAQRICWEHFLLVCCSFVTNILFLLQPTGCEFTALNGRKPLHTHNTK